MVQVVVCIQHQTYGWQQYMHMCGLCPVIYDVHHCCCQGVYSLALALTASVLPTPGEVGLEVCAGKDTTPQQAMQSGLWVPCDPVEGAITVNIGDALQYWSDGQLKSTYHRVRMPRVSEHQASARGVHLCKPSQACILKDKASRAGSSFVAGHKAKHVHPLVSGPFDCSMFAVQHDLTIHCLPLSRPYLCSIHHKIAQFQPQTLGATREGSPLSTLR